MTMSCATRWSPASSMLTMPSMPTPKLDLAIQFVVKKSQRPRRAEIRRWAKAALKADAMVALRIVDEDEARELNRDYRGKDYATNVLTFRLRGGGGGRATRRAISSSAPRWWRARRRSRASRAGRITRIWWCMACCICKAMIMKPMPKR
jgi:hypothetical protein